MKCRRFNSLMCQYHSIWAARVLNMSPNPNPGPDIIDDKKVIELKFTLIHPERKYPEAWTVMEHQMSYNNQRQAFWGLGSYHLACEVKNIKNGKNLDSLVTLRELWIVPWIWMYQYSPSQTSGRTKNSQWQNTFRYPKLKDLPTTTETYETIGGLIHLTNGVSPKHFNITTKEAPF